MTHVCLSVYYTYTSIIYKYGSYIQWIMGIIRMWTLAQLAHWEVAEAYINIDVLTEYYFICERKRESELSSSSFEVPGGAWAQIESVWFEWSKFTSLLLSDQCSLFVRLFCTLAKPNTQTRTALKMYKRMNIYISVRFIVVSWNTFNNRTKQAFWT